MQIRIKQYFIVYGTLKLVFLGSLTLLVLLIHVFFIIYCAKHVN